MRYKFAFAININIMTAPQLANLWRYSDRDQAWKPLLKTKLASSPNDKLARNTQRTAKLCREFAQTQTRTTQLLSKNNRIRLQKTLLNRTK